MERAIAGGRGATLGDQLFLVVHHKWGWGGQDKTPFSKSSENDLQLMIFPF